jgi:predicted HTH transcriptional regulator
MPSRSGLFTEGRRRGYRVYSKAYQQGILIGRVRRRELWSVPPIAIREAVMNAVVHMDYAQQGSPVRIAMLDDRIEVDNPGLLPFGLTVEDIRKGVSKLRNRVIGRVFHELRLIEQWDSGIQRMTAACVDAGLPAPVFEEVGTHFRVIISTVRQLKPRMDDRTAASLNPCVLRKLFQPQRSPG